MGKAAESIQFYASILGATGVGLGAIGAHALKETLSKGNHLDSYRTAVAYQLFHATALLGLSALAKDTNSNNNNNPTNESRLLLWSAQCMAAGTVLFSGSIYGLCLGIGPRKLLGPATPIGGLLMIGGWVLVGLGDSKKKQ